MSSIPESDSEFDPNAPGLAGSIFGLPYSLEDAHVVILPVPWDVTVSYHSGTSKGPQSVLNNSIQVDLFIPEIAESWKAPIAMKEISRSILEENRRVGEIVNGLTHVDFQSSNSAEALKLVNDACYSLKEKVASEAIGLISQEKTVAVLGGEHSTSLGLIQALSTKYPDFGILQIDAHADLRQAYQGFEFSHASVMYNALNFNSVSKLVQVGLRDLCDDEWHLISSSAGRVVSFLDASVKQELFSGGHWSSICDRIVDELPEHVYISFDIDGLSPYLCPGTGTPVPGGLEFEEARYLIHRVASSGKRIIGFDLCEVGPGDWDGNVGSRILYNHCIAAAASQGRVAYSR